jgi:hypothetical protein
LTGNLKKLSGSRPSRHRHRRRVGPIVECQGIDVRAIPRGEGAGGPAERVPPLTLSIQQQFHPYFTQIGLKSLEINES